MARMSRFSANPVGAGVATALVLGLFVVIPYLQLVHAAQVTAQRRAELLAEQAGLRVETFLTSSISAITTLATREATETFRSEAAFTSFAADFYRAFPGIVAVNLVDSGYVITWVYPPVENQAARGADLSGHPQAGPIIREADLMAAPRMTPGLTLLQGGTGFAIYIPRAEGPRRIGFVNLAFRHSELLSRIFPGWDDPDSSLTVSNGEQDIFTLGDLPPDQQLASASSDVTLLNQVWQVRVALALDDRPSRSLLAVGMLLAAGTGLAVAELLRRRSLAMETERRLAAVGQNAASVIYQRMLSPDGRITFPYVSQSIERVLGPSATPERLEKDPQFIWNRIVPEDVGPVQESVRRSSQAMVPWNEEFRMRRDDGSIVWLSGASRPHGDGLGNVICDGILIDITERKAAEQALARAEEQLRQLQRLESIGQLTGGIAHDFNNLLQIILGNLDLAREQITDQAKAWERMKVAFEAAERAAELTQQLLAFARKQTLAPRAVKVNDLVRRVDNMLRHTLGRDIRMEFQLADDVWDVFCDPAQLESALVNLAMNARDAMPDGGTLRIATANRALDDAYAQAHPDVHVGDYVAISVADTGVGMPPEVSARAFEPFFTTKEVGRGTGLGLAMVYGFVKQSGGHVDLVSEPGRGTEITMYLPKMPGTPSA